MGKFEFATIIYWMPSIEGVPLLHKTLDGVFVRAMPIFSHGNSICLAGFSKKPRAYRLFWILLCVRNQGTL